MLKMENKMNIRFSPPDVGETEIEEVIDAIKSGWITTGPKTKLFEQKITELCKTEKTVCLNSSTAAMEMTLRVLGVGPGDEVITSAYTYTASCSVICHVGATPVLVDIQKDNFEMDYDKLEQAITEKTKVIIPVDIGGVMCDYDRIQKIVEKKANIFKPSSELQEKLGRIAIMADSSHAIGAMRNGKMAGEYADFTSFSFHAVKNLTTAEGGAVTWKKNDKFDNEAIYKRYQLLSLFMIMGLVTHLINEDFGAIFAGIYMISAIIYFSIMDYRKNGVTTKKKSFDWFDLCIYGIIPALCFGPIAIVFGSALWFTIMCFIFFGSSYILYEKRLKKKQTK